MPYLLDSDWFIDYVDRVPSAVELAEGLSPSGLFISVVSYMEAYEGVFRLSQSDRAARLEEWLTGDLVITVDDVVARRCAELRSLLRGQNRRVGSRALDLLIAATAIAYDLTMVTRNVDGYRDIPGLTLFTQT